MTRGCASPSGPVFHADPKMPRMLPQRLRNHESIASSCNINKTRSAHCPVIYLTRVCIARYFMYIKTDNNTNLYTRHNRASVIRW